MGIQETAVDTVSELIKKEASGIMGMLFPYAGLKKKALDMYISDVEKSNMSSESKVIAVLNAKDTMKKLKNQKRIAEIAMDDAKEGTDFTSKSGVNKEWLDRFMDSAKFVSDDDVQFIWGKILGKEFENPGSTPLNMIRVLSEITPIYAQAFRKICSMQICIFGINDTGEIVSGTQRIMVPYRENEECLGKIGISFNIINELETLGLVKFESLTGYIATGLGEETVLSYVNGKTEVITEHNKGSIPIGNILLTAVGDCLKNITPVEKIEGYEDMVKKYMIENEVKYMEEPNYQVIEDSNGIRIEKKD